MRNRKADEYGFVTVTITAEDGTPLEKFTVEPKKVVARQNYFAERLKKYLGEAFTVNE